MWIFIRPTDVWLFRDGRPFSAGDYRATSLFPPTPFTMQGAVRAKVLLERNVPLDDYAYQRQEEITQNVVMEIGSPGDGYGSLRLRGLIVARDMQPLVQFFPAPADVVEVVGKDELRALQPLNDSPFFNNLSSELLPLWTRFPNVEAETDVHWLSEDEMREYLATEIITTRPQEERWKPFERESRFHVHINSAVKRPHQDEETGGHLFLVEFVRPREDAGLLLEVGTKDGALIEGFPGAGILQLGGEGRTAFYKEVNAIRLPDSFIRKQALRSGRFKIVFTTPAYFKDGAQPKNGEWGKFFRKATVTLKAIACGRALPIGGAKSDLKSQRGRERDGNQTDPKGKRDEYKFQKPIHHFVPAGSVYYFEADSPAFYDDCPVTETPDGEANFGQIGFGQILIGRWNYV